MQTAGARPEGAAVNRQLGREPKKCPMEAAVSKVFVHRHLVGGSGLPARMVHEASSQEDELAFGTSWAPVDSDHCDLLRMMNCSCFCLQCPHKSTFSQS